MLEANNFKKVLIMAPHPDDEIIGCFQLLHRKEVKHVCFITSEEEMYTSSKFFEFEIVPVEEVENTTWNAIFVPDPFERHPLHRKTWALGHQVSSKLGSRLGLYSTQMDASYVDLLPEKLAKLKMEVLNKIYHRKSDMWKYEHKYWLYEGVVLRL
ncbi:MAG: hypothetical protein QXP04_03775 [Candidatus Nanoarchaeia archaeon]